MNNIDLAMFWVKVDIPKVFNCFKSCGFHLISFTLSEVYEAVQIQTGKAVAVKVTNKKKLEGPDDVQSIRYECEVLKNLKHENIVECFGLFEDGENFYTVIELLQGGELFERICKKKSYNEKETRDVVYSVLSALNYLHSRNIAHRFDV